MDFILQIYISQGSVATQLRCGGIFYNHIANVPQNVPLKIENRSIFGKGMKKVFSLLFGPPCISDIKHLTCIPLSLFVSIIFTESQFIFSNVKRSHQ